MSHSPLEFDQTEPRDGLDLAIVGMAARFPGAPDLEAFWRNLCAGVESVSRLTPQELAEAGVDRKTAGRPNYVGARAVLEGIDLFDAPFFSMTPKEAETTDPQQRLLLECAWETLEHAGYDPSRYKGSIGVYAGSSTSGYLYHLFPRRVLLQSPAEMSAMLGVEKDTLATRLSYKLNLRGPSLAVQTACSTSLVAVHLACQALLSGECDMALAGGVSVTVPQKVGYLYQEGGIVSPDGHCRTFDAKAEGTVGGSGVGLVLLKRLQDALDEGDHILAVVKGSAVNNDGAAKVGYTAPSIEGQAQVIEAAHVAAGVRADTISYIEAHGTGTPMGDPIEVA
ncbi:MAG TPA: polyketide synthase type I, partial [Nitrospira sp.]|nr:polyketide synthase type I [Nitrospira sp.]